jgi:hypothetical protein
VPILNVTADETQTMIGKSETSNSGAGSQLEEKPKAPAGIVRDTWIRWVMLAFGSLFLMGSYFCYDNVAMVSDQLEAPPYDFKQY